MIEDKSRILGGIFIRKKFLNPKNINIKKKVITRKSISKKSPLLKKLGTVHQVKSKGFVIREFSNKTKAIKFKEKLIKDIKKIKKNG